MAEYIEKGALMSLIESEAHRWGDDYDWRQCLANIEDFKPADVRPVVRGRWIVRMSEVFPADSTIECDQCHEEQSAFISDSFCPNCGADMRGGDAE